MILTNYKPDWGGEIMVVPLTRRMLTKSKSSMSQGSEHGLTKRVSTTLFFEVAAAQRRKKQLLILDLIMACSPISTKTSTTLTCERSGRPQLLLS